ncbi:unnamed protein product [Larinioides sclopetarius]|uniref:Uncharacterized protein n=1 Tax=Larinioides sclopetarius TaxID=280406 RepID=A0AAV2B779_9ARAC
MSCWWVMLGIISTIAEARPSESERVTIDLSALRPSLPGLVLYKYGDVAPKLVQIDLSALNPQLQPHVIWPQFDELDLDERNFDMDNVDAIPYLSEEDTLMYNSYPKLQSQRMMGRMSGHWLDNAGRSDMYDFVSDSPEKQLLSLHGSLPVADEVIVPLDWEEEETKQKGKKRNVFLTKGWAAAGEKENKARPHLPNALKGISSNLNSYFTSKPVQERPSLRRRERESEQSHSAFKNHQPIEDTQFKSSAAPQNAKAEARIPSQDSWSVPRQYWSIPHFIVGNWQ